MFAFFFMLINSSMDAPPSFDAIKQQVLNARRAIRSMHVELNTVESRKDFKQTVRWVLWLDGAKLRGDRTASAKAFPNIRVVHCIGCDDKGHVLEYVEKPNLAAKLKPLSAFSEDKPYAAADPRHFGHTLGALLESNSPGFEGTFGAPHVGSAKVSAVKNESENCWLMEWSQGPQDRIARYSALISPERGHSLIKLKADIVSGNNRIELVTTSVPKLVNGIWFPSKIHMQQTMNGVVQLDEQATLQVHSINQPIEKSVFSLAGVEMMEGKTILLPSGSALQVSNGKIGPYPPEKEPTLPPPTPATDPAERQWNPWLLALSIALGLAAVALIVFRLRGKRESS